MEKIDLAISWKLVDQIGFHQDPNLVRRYTYGTDIKARLSPVIVTYAAVRASRMAHSQKCSISDLRRRRAGRYARMHRCTDR
ncbi:hypothetical protein EVAR_9016_1 [Eumeta japonica]|uniref:Uncharacterized protein n=1 Tax=Eumeta variegata TaxID=151549 RepID=A0A4C1TWB1_EUMVA|nr:hypothetical protein EVAR_9016_1 [Eumeta japonica]